MLYQIPLGVKNCQPFFFEDKPLPHGIFVAQEFWGKLSATRCQILGNSCQGLVELYLKDLCPIAATSNV